MGIQVPLALQRDLCTREPRLTPVLPLTITASGAPGSVARAETEWTPHPASSCLNDHRLAPMRHHARRPDGDRALLQPERPGRLGRPSPGLPPARNLLSGPPQVKAQMAAVVLVGGPKTIETYRALGAIDEFLLMVLPMFVGKGGQFTPDLSTDIGLTLTNKRTWPNSVVEVVYELTPGDSNEEY